MNDPKSNSSESRPHWSEPGEAGSAGRGAEPRASGQRELALELVRVLSVALELVEAGHNVAAAHELENGRRSAMRALESSPCAPPLEPRKVPELPPAVESALFFVAAKLEHATPLERCTLAFMLSSERLDLALRELGPGESVELARRLAVLAGGVRP